MAAVLSLEYRLAPEHAWPASVDDAVATMRWIARGPEELEDVLLHDCKLDYANLRGASLRHVTFSDCVLLDTDFGGAALESVRFEGCALQGTDFSRAAMTEVDLRGSDHSAIGGDVAALRGAIVDSSQLIDLARPLAAAAGIKVDDGGD